MNEAGAVRRFLQLAVFPAVASGLLLVLQAKLLAQICHRLVMDGAALHLLRAQLVTVIVLIIVRSLLGFASEKAAATAAASLKQSVRTRLFSSILRSAATGRFADSGVLIEAVTHGVDSLESYFSRFLPQLALAATIPAACLVFAFPVDWRVALVFAMSAPFIPLFMILIGRGAESLNRRQWGRLSVLSGHLLDLVQGLPDIRICSAVRREAAAVARLSEEYRQATMSVLRLAFLSALTLEFFTTVGTAVIAVIIGFRLLDGSLRLADGLFLLLVAPDFYLPFRQLGLSYHARMQGVAAAEQLIPLLTVSQDAAAAVVGEVPPQIELQMQLEGVSFRYPNGRDILQQVDLALVPGLITALVGDSGAGKSTLARLLTGMAIPSSGKITANGRDIARFDRSAWNARIAWLPQKPFFFAGTVRENLTIGLAETSTESLDTALASAEALDFVRRLPGGLDARLGENGAGLSGGELRRLAIARIFLRSPGLVVLDEPTAGLDPVNEQLICNCLKKLAIHSTILLISHRAATVRWADRVFALQNGRVDELTAVDWSVDE